MSEDEEKVVKALAIAIMNGWATVDECTVILMRIIGMEANDERG